MRNFFFGILAGIALSVLGYSNLAPRLEPEMDLGGRQLKRPGSGVLQEVARLLNSNQRDEARALVKSEIAKKPRSSELHRTLARILFHDAAAPHEYEPPTMPADALAEFDAALALTPADIDLREEVFFQYQAGRMGKRSARPFLEDWARAVPESRVAHQELARVLEATGLTEPALVECRRVLKLDPRRPVTDSSFTALLSRLGQSGLAEGAFQATITQFPSDPEAPLAYARFLDARERLPEARAMYERAIQVSRWQPGEEPGRPRFGAFTSAVMDYVSMLLREGKCDEAARVFLPGVELSHMSLWGFSTENQIRKLASCGHRKEMLDLLHRELDRTADSWRRDPLQELISQIAKTPSAAPSAVSTATGSVPPTRGTTGDGLDLQGI